MIWGDFSCLSQRGWEALGFGFKKTLSFCFTLHRSILQGLRCAQRFQVYVGSASPALHTWICPGCRWEDLAEMHTQAGGGHPWGNSVFLAVSRRAKVTAGAPG